MIAIMLDYKDDFMWYKGPSINDVTH